MHRREFHTDEKAAQASQMGIDLIDVRDPNQFAEGHIAGAVNIPWTDIQNYDVKPGSYLYCNSGRKSEMARKVLESRNIQTENIGGVRFYSGKLEKSQGS